MKWSEEPAARGEETRAAVMNKEDVLRQEVGCIDKKRVQTNGLLFFFIALDIIKVEYVYSQFISLSLANFWRLLLVIC